jgi:hypothetical protein
MGWLVKRQDMDAGLQTQIRRLRAQVCTERTCLGVRMYVCIPWCRLCTRHRWNPDLLSTSTPCSHGGRCGCCDLVSRVGRWILTGFPESCRRYLLVLPMFWRPRMEGVQQGGGCHHHLTRIELLAQRSSSSRRQRTMMIDEVVRGYHHHQSYHIVPCRIVQHTQSRLVQLVDHRK